MILLLLAMVFISPLCCSQDSFSDPFDLLHPPFMGLAKCNTQDLRGSMALEVEQLPQGERPFFPFSSHVKIPADLLEPEADLDLGDDFCEKFLTEQAPAPVSYIQRLSPDGYELRQRPVEPVPVPLIVPCRPSVLPSPPSTPPRKKRGGAGKSISSKTSKAKRKPSFSKLSVRRYGTSTPPLSQQGPSEQLITDTILRSHGSPCREKKSDAKAKVVLEGPKHDWDKFMQEVFPSTYMELAKSTIGALRRPGDVMTSAAVVLVITYDYYKVGSEWHLPGGFDRVHQNLSLKPFVAQLQTKGQFSKPLNESMRQVQDSYSTGSSERFPRDLLAGSGIHGMVGAVMSWLYKSNYGLDTDGVTPTAGYSDVFTAIQQLKVMPQDEFLATLSALRLKKR